jgi:hypothetical protein
MSQNEEISDREASMPLTLQESGLVEEDEFGDCEEEELKLDSETSLIKTLNQKIDNLGELVSSFISKCKVTSVPKEPTNMEEDETKGAAGGVPDTVGIDQLLLPCRSILHIETFFPFLSYENDHFKCQTCENFLSSAPVSSLKKYLFNYEESNGVDFSHLKILPRVFRNLKGTLKAHIKESELHKSAVSWKEERMKECETEQKQSTAAGFTLGDASHGFLVYYNLLEYLSQFNLGLGEQLVLYFGRSFHGEVYTCL